MKAPNRNFHSGMSFELWTSQGSWFWGLINPRRKGGIVGAALTEAEARCEARSAIEELANGNGSGSGASRHECSAS